MKATFGTLVLLSALAGTGCRPAVDPTVVARVGSREIRVTDVQKEAARQARNSGSSPDRDQVLEDLIHREQLLARARALGLDRDPAVRRALDNLLIGHLRERELEEPFRRTATEEAESPEPTPADIAPERPRAERRIAVLQATIADKASPSARQRQWERLSQGRQKAIANPGASADFGELAAEFSDEPGSRFRGGDIGWVSLPAPRSRWSTNLLAAAFSLARPGAISEIIESGRHLYVVKLLEERSAPSRSGTPSPGARAHREGQQRRQEFEARFMEAVRSSTPVIRFPENLRAVEVATGPRPDATVDVPQLP